MLICKRPIGTISYVPGYGQTNFEAFTWSFAQLVQYSNEFCCLPSKGEYCHLERGMGSDVVMSRNYLARVFLGDWLFQSDMDHKFEPDLLARMLGLFNGKSPDGDRIDVLSGFYRYRSHPHLPVVFHYDESVNAHMIVGQLDWNADLQQINGCVGAGCLLIRRSVFERIANELREEPFTLIPPWGEDYSFGERCRKLGIKWWLAPKIHSRHLIVKEVTEDMYDPTCVELMPSPTGGVAIGEVVK